MRTTLDLDDGIWRKAKRLAADRGTTLSRVVEDALHAYTAAPRAQGKPFRLELITKTGRRVPGIRFDDRDALYDQMEGRA